MSHSSTWQDALDPPFVQRLLRPWLRPGRIDPRMTSAIFARYQPMTPLPLVDQLTRRQNRIAAQQAPSQPIVYAQPTSFSTAVTQGSSTPIDRPQSSAKPTIIQAKFASSKHPTTPSSTSQSTVSSSVPAPTPEARLMPAPNAVERSTYPASPDLLDLPLVQPANPPTPESSPLLRSKRPRFERDINRQLPDRVADLSDQTEPLSSPLPSPSTAPLPLVSTAVSDLSIPLETQRLHPIAADPQSTILQNKSTHQDSPLVTVPLSQFRNQDNHPELLVVRSPQREGSIASVNLENQRKSPLYSGTERAIAFRAPVETTKQPLRQPSSSSRPLVQVSHSIELPGQPVSRPAITQPLVFSAPASRAIGESTANGSLTHARNLQSIGSNDRNHAGVKFGKSAGTLTTPSQAVPVVSAQLQSAQPPPIDVDALADRVERKLMRRLVVERERRGWSR